MYENARFAIIETCLALTVFRPDLTGATIFYFTGLLFVKAFHWLAQVSARFISLSRACRFPLTPAKSQGCCDKLARSP